MQGLGNQRKCGVEGSFLDQLLAVSLAYEEMGLDVGALLVVDNDSGDGPATPAAVDYNIAETGGEELRLVSDVSYASAVVAPVNRDPVKGKQPIDVKLEYLYPPTPHHSPAAAGPSGTPIPLLAAEDVESMPPPVSIDCGICMECKPLAERFAGIQGCQHVFCKECVALYVAAKVEENVARIPCPEPGCRKGELHPESCHDILPEQVFLRWGAALCESAIADDASLYCPFKDCSALLLLEDDAKNRSAESECPHCHRLFCSRCMSAPWHNGLTCEAFLALGDGNRTQEDVMLANIARSSRWQRCPKCGVFVDRVDGCVFIKCRCKHCFCYVCAAAMDPSKHHCNKCNITWDR